MNGNIGSRIASLDPRLAKKIREIIEDQWGKRIEDIKYLSIEQFYERIVQQGRVSYKPTNRFMLQAKFPTAREPRRVTFSLPA